MLSRLRNFPTPKIQAQPFYPLFSQSYNKKITNVTFNELMFRLLLCVFANMQINNTLWTHHVSPQAQSRQPLNHFEPNLRDGSLWSWQYSVWLSNCWIPVYLLLRAHGFDSCVRIPISLLDGRIFVGENVGFYSFLVSKSNFANPKHCKIVFRWGFTHRKSKGIFNVRFGLFAYMQIKAAFWASHVHFSIYPHVRSLQLLNWFWFRSREMVLSDFGIAQI